MRPALLLVDVQNDFLNRAELSPRAATFEAGLAALLACVRGQGWPVVHARTLVKADGSDAMPHWRKSGQLWCAEGSAGAEPPAALGALPGEIVVTKRFFSAFASPGLLTYLRAAQVGKLVIAGLYTHACVRSTALDAYGHGFEAYIPTDAVASYDKQHAELSLEWLDGRAAQCLPSAHILALLGEE